MKKCVFCEKEFETLSCEHIIPNALCGHLKSNELLCRDCNSTLGSVIDKLLNGKFDMIINMFGLVRENGNPPPALAKLVSGRPCSVLHGGQPVGEDVQINISTDSENHVVLHINAPENNKKLLNMEISKFIAKNKDIFAKHSLDYKKIIPSTIIGVSEKIKKDEVEHHHNHEQVHFQIDFGGKDFFRAILKILYLFLLHHNRNIKIDRQDIINKIKSGEDICDIFFYCFDPEKLFTYHHIGLYHSIGIKSFQSERKLLGFIDLFGITPFICVLDDNYDGEDIILSYGYDFLRKKEEKPNINFSRIPLDFRDKYYTTTTERVAHCKGKLNSLFQLFTFYSIPEKIIQDLLVVVNYEPAVCDFFSRLKPKLQELIISNIDRLLPQKEKGCSLMRECILRGILAAFRNSKSKFKNKP